MASAKHLSRLERDRSKTLEEIRLLQKKLELKQLHVELLNDELQVAIRYTTSPRAAIFKKKMEEEKENK